MVDAASTDRQFARTRTMFLPWAMVDGRKLGQQSATTSNPFSYRRLPSIAMMVSHTGRHTRRGKKKKRSTAADDTHPCDSRRPVSASAPRWWRAIAPVGSARSTSTDERGGGAGAPRQTGHAGGGAGASTQGKRGTPAGQGRAPKANGARRRRGRDEHPRQTGHAGGGAGASIRGKRHGGHKGKQLSDNIDDEEREEQRRRRRS